MQTENSWKDLKEEIIKRLTWQEVYGEIQNQKHSPNGIDVTGKCPFHSDKTNSFAFNKDTLMHVCFAGCGKGSAFDFTMQISNQSFKDTLLALGRRLNISLPEESSPSITVSNDIISQDTIKSYQKKLSSKHKEYLVNVRGLDIETIEKAEIGFGKFPKIGKRLTIPIKDESGKYVNIRCYNPESKLKMMPFKSGYGSQLYGLSILNTTPKDTIIILCEGEFDCLLLQKLGFTAITSTAGVATFKKDWEDHLKDRHIVICFDCDTAGNAESNKLTKRLSRKGLASLKRIKLPLTGKKDDNDIGDFFLKNKKTVADFQKLIDEAKDKSIIALNSDRFFMLSNDGSKRFICKYLADELIEEYHCVTVHEQIYIYDNGVYDIKYGERILHRLCYEKLKEEATQQRSRETLAYIRAMTDKREEDLNTYQEYINVMNGMLDVRNGEILPHDPKYLSTLRIPIEYDKNATCPKIDNFFQTTVDPDCIPFIFEYFGYILVADTTFHTAVMLLGSGRNGKSTYIKLINAFLGKQNVTHYSLSMIEKDKFAKAGLYNKLVNVCADIDAKRIESSEAFKAIVGGDSIMGEEKYKSAFTFEPFSRLIFSANKMPTSSDKTKGFYRRWRIINFEKCFEGQEEIKNYADILIEELPGLLNKALIGMNKLYKKRDFTESKSSENAINMYQRDNNSALYFLDEEFKATNIEENMIDSRELYNEYLTFCGEENIGKPVSKISFGMTVCIFTGYSSKKKKVLNGGTARFYLGIERKSENEKLENI